MARGDIGFRGFDADYSQSGVACFHNVLLLAGGGLEVLLSEGAIVCLETCNIVRRNKHEYGRRSLKSFSHLRSYTRKLMCLDWVRSAHCHLE